MQTLAQYITCSVKDNKSFRGILDPFLVLYQLPILAFSLIRIEIVDKTNLDC